MQYRYIFALYATTIGFVTAEFDGIFAPMLGLKTSSPTVLGTIIVIWLILLTSLCLA